MRNQIPLINSSTAIKFINLNSDHVILFGAGEYVEIIIHCLKLLDIHNFIICDNNKDKHGTYIGGYKITSPILAHYECPGARVIVSASPRHFTNLKITANELGWMHIFDGAFLMANFSYDSNSFKEGLSSVHFKLDRFFFEYFKRFFYFFF